MDPIVILVGSLLAGGITLCAIPLLSRLARRWGWVDAPDEDRRFHSEATPNVGGVAIAAGLLVGAGVLALGLETAELQQASLWAGVAGALILFGMGLYDDIHGVGFKRKFFVQILVAYGLLHAGFEFNLAGIPLIDGDPHQLALYSIPLTMLWIVGVINAVNLIDGLDGLAAGVSAIAVGALALLFGYQGAPALAALAAVLLSATVAFLWYNFHPASIFMGDSGSMLLGYLLALLPLAQPLHADPLVALLLPVVVLGVPVLDTGLTVLRRTVRRKAICGPDANHIHHRLARRTTEARAVLRVYAAGTWFGAMALLMALMTPLRAYLIFGATVLVAMAWVKRLGYVDLLLDARDRKRHQEALETATSSEASGLSAQNRNGGENGRVEVEPEASRQMEQGEVEPRK